MTSKNITTTQENPVYDFHGHNVRVIMRDGEPWFVAKDVAEILGYRNTSKAISDNCKDKGVTISYTLTAGGKQAIKIINEGNLYRLVMRSKLPAAEAFEDWVVNDVLPSIRKTGGYSQSAPMTPEQLMAHALIAAKETIDKQAKELEVANNSLHEIAVSDGDYCITDAAKTLGVKPSFLFSELASRKWIYRREEGGDWKGMQTAINAGYMLHKLIVVPSNGGDLRRTQVRITNQGVVRLAKEFAAREVEQKMLASL